MVIDNQTWALVLIIVLILIVGYISVSSLIASIKSEENNLEKQLEEGKKNFDRWKMSLKNRG